MVELLSFLKIHKMLIFHLFRCLKAGMKPELVDAAFRRKSPHKKLGNFCPDEPFLIENLKPLHQDDISDILMVKIAMTN